MVTYMLLYRKLCSRVALSSTNAICANRWRQCFDAVIAQDSLSPSGGAGTSNALVIPDTNAK